LTFLQPTVVVEDVIQSKKILLVFSWPKMNKDWCFVLKLDWLKEIYQIGWQ
jgi:hypothetical protein